MLTKRIIPCLDIRDGRTVKGVNFEGMQDAGDPVELAVRYMEQGADELVFLDISATDEKRKTLSALVGKIAKEINIPFTVGGGISSVEDVSELLNAGADKISLNSSALKNPELISLIAGNFGSQCVVVAIDAKFSGGEWIVFSNGGKIGTGRRVKDWAKNVENLGAGEILLTSIGNDGTKGGFANELTKETATAVNISVIASGGAGTMEHFRDVFRSGGADAALAASVFHFGEIKIPLLKQYLKENNISVR